jgi:tRNA1Val (adenine37-N6)-methyltransferase
MPNNYFQFKEFTIYQEKSALKVNTDSCVFGAWSAKKLLQWEFHTSHCLDIGAGTGLLMLMLAQQFPGPIDGVEIDRDSYEQAMENIKTSAWYDRLHLFHNDIKLFSSLHQYDFIISNPPFFESHLKSPKQKNNFAKHDEGLNLSDLLEIADRNLTARGHLAVLLPYHRSDYFEELAAGYELFVTDKLLMRQSAQHPFFRTALLLNRKNKGLVKKEELTIRHTASTYSPTFISLLKNYYLYL